MYKYLDWLSTYLPNYLVQLSVYRNQTDTTTTTSPSPSSPNQTANRRKARRRNKLVDRHVQARWRPSGAESAPAGGRPRRSVVNSSNLDLRHRRRVGLAEFHVGSIFFRWVVSLFVIFAGFLLVPPPRWMAFFATGATSRFNAIHGLPFSPLS